MGYISHHIFENRLYLGNPEKIQATIQEVGHLKGASIRSYSDPIGWILSLIGLASKVWVGNNEIYINNKSFVKHTIRIEQLDQSPKDSVDKYEATMRVLNAIFRDSQEKGYNQDRIQELQEKFQQQIKAHPNRQLHEIQYNMMHMDRITI